MNRSALSQAVFKKKIRTIFSICAKSIAASIILETIIYLAHNYSRPDDLFFGEHYWYQLGITVLLAAVIPLIILTFHVFVLESKTMKKVPYWIFLVLLFTFFITVIFLSTLAVGILLGGNGAHSIDFVYALIFSAILGFVFILAKVFHQFIGRTFFRNYFRGKYHHPRKEDKVFAFIDLSSSTQIGENLDYNDFFSLINDFIYIVDQCVDYYGGEIYKYIDDGVLVVWPSRKDIYKKVIQCIVSLEEEIHFKQDFFKRKYGLGIKYTAGFHAGPVFTGRIGENRCEIAYLGDTVNTTQRVQGACSFYNSHIILSKELVEMSLIHFPEAADVYNFEPLGDIILKGKVNPLTLMKPVLK